MKRRHFLPALAALTGGLTLHGNNAYAESLTGEELQSRLAGEQPLSPRFWQIIKKQFLLPEDYDYFNTGGLGACPFAVIEKVKNSITELQTYPQPGHDLGKWGAIKDKCAGLLSPSIAREEIALTGCTTEGNCIVVNGLPLERGDEVITSTHEHAGLIVPLLNRKERDGIVIRTFEPDMENGLGNVDRISSLITKRTKLIFISHFTCTTGQIFPVREIGRLAKEKGILYALDGAQTIGAKPVDIEEYGCDFYATCGHKWLLGPARTGIFYIRKSLLDRVRPLTVGGYSDSGHDVFAQTLTLESSAQRYEYATVNSALYFGLETAIDFINTIGLDNVWQHNKNLAEQFCRGLQQIPQAEILSPKQAQYRSSLITFKLKNVDFHKAASYLTGEKRMRVRVVPEANVNGVRASFHVYNNEEQVERLLAEIGNLASGRVY